MTVIQVGGAEQEMMRGEEIKQVADRPLFSARGETSTSSTTSDQPTGSRPGPVKVPLHSRGTPGLCELRVLNK